MNPVLVSLEHVSREYDGGRIRAVQDICLSVREGEHMAVLGASGSGKTTLLNLLTGLDTPTRGRVRFLGRTPRTRTHWASLRARHVGFVFQSFNLLPTLTALENVQVPMFSIRVGRRTRVDWARQLLERVGLGNRLGHLPSELSGGERQRVAIARSLANNPQLLVADEPTGNLDRTSAEQVRAMLHDAHLSEGRALVVVTHDPLLADRADRVIRISDGAIVGSHSGSGDD